MLYICMYLYIAFCSYLSFEPLSIVQVCFACFFQFWFLHWNCSESFSWFCLLDEILRYIVFLWWIWVNDYCFCIFNFQILTYNRWLFYFLLFITWNNDFIFTNTISIVLYHMREESFVIWNKVISYYILCHKDYTTNYMYNGIYFVKITLFVILK